MANGIIVIDKPQGWTSHDVVAKLRGFLGEKRIGHAGTLDPLATGVLPVFVGRATRAVEFAAETGKEYLTGLRLGTVTDTQDITGTILEQHAVDVSRETLQRALGPFMGDIQQLPPMYSALKVGGKKLYELARQGQVVERAPRPITIYALEILEQTAPTDYLLRVACAKGTYMRTLCHDIGGALGCGGTMYALRRTQAAGFGLHQAVTLEAVGEAAAQGTAQSLLMPVDTYFSAYPAATVDETSVARIKHGAVIPWSGGAGTFRVYGPAGDFLMVGKAEHGCLTAVKSFFDV